MSAGGGGPRPPKTARRILERRLPLEVRDFLLGDLEERFRTLARTDGVGRARRWYWRQAVAALLTPRRALASGFGDAGVGQDVAQGLKALLRQPLHSAAAVAALGLGVGVVGAAVAILWGTVVAGLPFEESHRLVHFERSNVAEGQFSLAVTPHDYQAWREGQRSFEDMGAYVEARALLPNEGSPPDRYEGVRISASSFRLLRVEAARGRTFRPDDEVPGAPEVVLLSHALWSSRFGGDPGIVGADIQMNGRPTTVVGVMPEGFGFPIAERFWLPLRLDFTRIQRGTGRLDVFGRLLPGVDVDAARADFLRIAEGLEEAYPATNQGVRAELRTFQEEYVGGDFKETVMKMLAGAVLVLLICCANVANLLLVRGAQRGRELAVRAALGAGRGRIVRQLLAESGALALGGGLVGLLIAQAGVTWFNRAGAQAGVFALPHGSDSLFWWDVGLHPVPLLLIVGVTGVAAVLAGLAPAVRVSRGGVSQVLREGGRGAAGTRPGHFAGTLVVAQVALTTGLAVVAGFVVLSSVELAQARGVVDGSGILTTRVDLPLEAAESPEIRYPDHDSRVRAAEALAASLRDRPGVEVAAVGSALPLSRPRLVPFATDGAPSDPDQEPRAGVVNVTPAYFDVFGVAPVEGRVFSEEDEDGAEAVAVVNASFAARYLPGPTAVGSRLRLGAADGGQPWLRVIGVVPDLWEEPDRPEREAGIYLPLAQSGVTDPALHLGPWGLSFLSVAVRPRAGAVVGIADMSGAVYAVDPDLPLRDVTSWEELSAQRTGRYRVWGRFYLAFAAAALLLAALGVYAVLAFDVSARTGEIGVRRAMGASGAGVQWEVMRGALVRIGAGAGVGLVLGYFLAEGATRVLYGVDIGNLSVFAGVAGTLGLVGALASWIPARQASRVDPLVAMRSD